MRIHYQTVNNKSIPFGVLLSGIHIAELGMDKKDPPIVANRRRRLQSWIDIHHNGVQAAFIEKTGINQGELSSLLKSKSFGEKKARKLELDCDMPDMWLDCFTLDNNISNAPDLKGQVPLISSVPAGDFREAIDNLHPGDYERMIDVSVPVMAHTFALRVEGDSMEPEFRHGDIIIVEPDMQPEHGDYVIAKNGGDATFKQLWKEGADWYLKPLNDRYPIKPLHDSHIIGVVREKSKRYR